MSTPVTERTPRRKYPAYSVVMTLILATLLVLPSSLPIHAQGGDKDVKIVLGQERFHQPVVSSVGKPLPDFKDIEFDFSPDDTKI